MALFAKLLADGIAAPALPNDGVVQRPSRLAVEDEHGLALVGQAQAGECGQAVRVARWQRHESRRARSARFPPRRVPPSPAEDKSARVRVRLGPAPALGVEEHGLGGGSALVYGEKGGHGTGGPKSEIRNPKEVRNPKSDRKGAGLAKLLLVRAIGPAGFGFRASEGAMGANQVRFKSPRAVWESPSIVRP